MVLFVPLCLIVGWIAFSGYRIYQAGTSLQASQDELVNLMNSAESIADIDPVKLDNIIREVREDVVVLDTSARPFLPITPYLTFLPRVGPLMADAESYLDLADAATNAASTLRPTLQTALLTAQEDRVQTDNQFAYLVTLLQDAQPNLNLIETDVARIQSSYAELESKEELPWAVRQFIPLADEFLPEAGTGLDLAQIVPTLFEGDKLYHVWIQNNDELRGTGGFVNGVVLLRISDGSITEFEYQSSEAINGNWEYLDQLPEPPPPLAEFMLLPVWITQDASYYPNFPTSAENGLNLYTIQQPNEPPADGVIAIDQIFVRKMLDAIGPTYIPALDTTITGDNIIEVMREFFDNPAGLEEGENRIQARRNFIGQMTEALQERMTDDASSLDLFALARVGIDAAAARNVQVYMRDDVAARTIAELGWNGAMEEQADRDSLAVVDNNIGYNKVNAVVNRSTRYAIKLADVGPHASSLAVTYRHTAPPSADACIQFQHYNRDTVYADLFNRCYYNYVRVYSAPSAELVGSSSEPISGEFLLNATDYDGAIRPITDPRDQSGFATLLLIPQGSESVLSMDLSIPASVVQPRAEGIKEYRLMVRKQAGMLSENATIQVTLPPGAALVDTSPIPTATEGNIVIFQQEVTQDVEIVVRYK